MKLFNAKSPAVASNFANNASNFRARQEASSTKEEIDAVGKIIYSRLSNLTDDELADPGFMSRLVGDLNAQGFSTEAIFAGANLAKDYTNAATTRKLAKEVASAKEASASQDANFYSNLGTGTMPPSNKDQAKTLMDWNAANAPKDPNTAELNRIDKLNEAKYKANTKQITQLGIGFTQDPASGITQANLTQENADKVMAMLEKYGLKAITTDGTPISRGMIGNLLHGKEKGVKIQLIDYAATKLPSSADQGATTGPRTTVSAEEANALINKQKALVAEKAGVARGAFVPPTRPGLTPQQLGIAVTNTPDMQMQASSLMNSPPNSSQDPIGAAMRSQQPALQQLQPQAGSGITVTNTPDATPTLERLADTGTGLGKKVIKNKNRIDAFPDINRDPLLGEKVLNEPNDVLEVGNHKITVDTSEAEMQQIIEDLPDAEIVYAFRILKQKKEVENSLTALEERLYSYLKSATNTIVSKTGE